MASVANMGKFRACFGRRFRFPAVRVTGRLHGSQFGRSLGQAEWRTALRLSLWPFAVVGTRLAQARAW